MTKEVARKKLDLPLKNKIVLYTGNLHPWKGVGTLALAVEKLDSDIETYIIGGSDEGVKDFKSKYGHIKNLKMTGYRPHGEIALWQWAADVLVVPNSAKEKIYLYETSPLKLFEYMATQTTPIIASNTPAIAEILSEKNAVLIEPDNPEVLAKTINQVLDNDYSDRAEQAFLDVQNYTWDKRAKNILKKLSDT